MSKLLSLSNSNSKNNSYNADINNNIIKILYIKTVAKKKNMKNPLLIIQTKQKNSKMNMSKKK